MENIKHLLNDWSQGKLLILLPGPKDSKLTVSQESSLKEICIAGNFEAGNPLDFVVTAVVSQHLRALLPSDILTFLMLPAQRFWLGTVSLLDVIALKVTMRAHTLEKQFLPIKRNMLFLWFFFLFSLRRTTLEPALYVHVRKVCVLLGVNKKEKRKADTNSRCPL